MNRNKKLGDKRKLLYEYSSREIDIKEVIIREENERKEVAPPLYTYFLSPLGSGHPVIAIQPQYIKLYLSGENRRKQHEMKIRRNH